MPKTVILEITQSADDAVYLHDLSKSSKLAKKCVYVGTFGGRFVLCYEKHCGKFVYYAVDMLSGKFIHVHESSFEFSQSALVREIGKSLVHALKYTGFFNPAGGSREKSRKRIWGTVSSL